MHSQPRLFPICIAFRQRSRPERLWALRPLLKTPAPVGAVGIVSLFASSSFPVLFVFPFGRRTSIDSNLPPVQGHPRRRRATVGGLRGRRVGPVWIVAGLPAVRSGQQGHYPPKEQPPRNLSGHRTARNLKTLWKAGVFRRAPPKVQAPAPSRCGSSQVP